MAAERLYYTVEEISEMAGVCTSKAYDIIRDLNSELAEMGYIVISGKVPKLYFAERYYGAGKVLAV